MPLKRAVENLLKPIVVIYIYDMIWCCRILVLFLRFLFDDCISVEAAKFEWFFLFSRRVHTQVPAMHECRYRVSSGQCEVKIEPENFHSVSLMHLKSSQGLLAESRNHPESFEFDHRVGGALCFLVFSSSFLRLCCLFRVGFTRLLDAARQGNIEAWHGTPVMSGFQNNCQRQQKKRQR